MFRLLFFLLLIFNGNSNSAFAQTPRIAALKKQLLLEVDEARQLPHLFILCEERASLPTDTLYNYASRALNVALKNKDRKAILLAEYYLIICAVKEGKLDTAMQMINNNVAALTQLPGTADLQNKYTFVKSQLLIKTNKQKEAIEINYKTLAKAELEKDTLTQITACNFIGWAYMELNQNREAISWFIRAINTGRPVYFDQYNIMFANLAATYNTIGKNDSAAYFISSALYYAQKQQNLQTIANALNIQADIFIDTKRSAEAEAPLAKALEIRKQIGDPFYVISDMTQLAIYYAHNGQPAKGIALCMDGLKMAEQYKMTAKLFILYDALAENYKAAGNYRLYAETLQKLMAVKDSAYKMASADALAEMQTRYDLQNKENIIIQQQLGLANKNYWLYGTIALSVFILILAIVLFTGYRRKQRLKLRFMQQEEQQKMQRAVIEAEEAERKRIAADLHDSLGAYAASIAANIDQLHVPDTTDNPVMKDLRNNAQAMVSQLNDTIWVLKKDALSLTAISDRLKVFIQRLQSSYAHIQIDVLEEIETDYLLPPLQAFHLFQMIKEALTNALKHSKGNRLIITIAGADGWQIIINDNGLGMLPKEKQPEGGNGILSMKERAKDAGFTIDWIRGKGEGTSVSISPTTN